MKTISFEEFSQLMEPIKFYDNEISSINTAMKPFLNGGNLEVGYFLMDAYIDLVAKYLEIDSEYVSWFVFDDEWGDAKKVLFRKKIKNIHGFYNDLLKNA